MFIHKLINEPFIPLVQVGLWFTHPKLMVPLRIGGPGELGKVQIGVAQTTSPGGDPKPVMDGPRKWVDEWEGVAGSTEAS